MMRSRGICFLRAGAAQVNRNLYIATKPERLHLCHSGSMFDDRTKTSAASPRLAAFELCHLARRVFPTSLRLARTRPGLILYLLWHISLRSDFFASGGEA